MRWGLCVYAKGLLLILDMVGYKYDPCVQNTDVC